MPDPLPIPPLPPPPPPPPPPVGVYTAPATTVGPSYGGILFQLDSGSPQPVGGLWQYSNSGIQANFNSIFAIAQVVLPTPPAPGNLWHYFLYAAWHFTGGCDYPDGSDVLRNNILFPYPPLVDLVVYAASTVATNMYAMPRGVGGYPFPPASNAGFHAGAYTVKYRLVVYNVKISIPGPLPPLPAHDQWYTGGTVTFT